MGTQDEQAQLDLLADKDDRRTYKAPLTMGESDVEVIRVTKSNTLIRAQNMLTARQQKVLAACISMIDPTGHYPDADVRGIEVQLSLAELSQLTGIERRHITRFIDETAKAFHSQAIRHPGSKEGEINWINIALQSSYCPDSKHFKLIFHPMLVRHLIELDIYTSYHIKYFKRLGSKYAIRLYELVCMSHNTKRSGPQFRKIPIDDLYFSLGKKEDDKSVYWRNFSEAERRILKPAVKEINEKTDFEVTYKKYKDGVRIAGITLVTTIKSQEKSKLSGPEPTASPLAMLLRHGIAKTTAERWVSRYPEQQIRSNVTLLENRLEAGDKIKNVGAYLNSLLSNNVAALPDVANPFSRLYPAGAEGHRRFVKEIVVPIWWKLPEGLQKSVQEHGFQNHEVTADVMDRYLSELKVLGEVDRLEFDPDSILIEWTDRWEGE